MYGTRDEAMADVFDYIERFYSAKRRHPTLRVSQSVEFEMNWARMPEEWRTARQMPDAELNEV